VVAEAKKREAAQRKAAVMPKQNSESAKERAQRAREITQAKIEADKAAKAKMQAANSESGGEETSAVELNWATA